MDLHQKMKDFLIIGKTEVFYLIAYLSKTKETVYCKYISNVFYFIQNCKKYSITLKVGLKRMEKIIKQKKKEVDKSDHNIKLDVNNIKNI